MLGKKVNRFFLGKVKRLFGDLRDRYDVIIAYRPGICTELAAFTFKGKKKITWWHHGIMTFLASLWRNYTDRIRKWIVWLLFLRAVWHY